MLLRMQQFVLTVAAFAGAANFANASIVVNDSTGSAFAMAGPNNPIPVGDSNSDVGAGPAAVSADSGEHPQPNPSFNHQKPPSQNNIKFLAGAIAHSQTSFTITQNAGALSLTTSGSANSTAQGDSGSLYNAVSSSDYTLTFTLDNSYNYAISGYLSFVFGNQYGGNPNASITLAHAEVGGGTVEDFSATGPSQPISASGILAPGIYVLSLSSSADVSLAGPTPLPPGVNSGFNVQFSLTPTPEPGTPALLGLTGLALLARRSRRIA